MTPRPSGRFSRSNALALALLAVGMTIFGSDKSPATRALQRFLSRDSAESVTAEDVARGYRAPAEGEGGIVPPPEGAVTNARWRLRGAYDDAFRPELPDWRFPVRDGVLTGLTVLARGEIRPDVGTLYFPVPLTNGLSLLPQARWDLLARAPASGAQPNGGEPASGGAPVPGAQASVFWHAQSPSNSLLLTWERALVGRDLNSPTNFQAELFPDGRFAYRTDDTCRLYLPVFDFDWDGDGLENSVDPDPLAAGPDAHGANAEWYRVVCSNVFAAVDHPSAPESNNPDNPNNQTILPEGVAFRPGVHTNAYYFVDVVAERGPAPVWFNADRESRLGSPVVVARPGETNRVPLLVGVEYAVTSTVPISVAAPGAMYAVVMENDERNVTVKWPLEFEFVENTSGSYSVNVGPFNPGGSFAWNNPNPARGGALPAIANTHGTSCGCWTGSGTEVNFNCSSGGSCSGGCIARGVFICEAEFAVTGGVCRCTRSDDPHEVHPPPEPNPMVGGLTISFSRPAVMFEDLYTNSPNEVVARRSTTVRLDISASGGPLGGSFTLSPHNLEKLIVANGPGPVVVIPGMTLAPHETYSISYECQGMLPSGSENDVEVEGAFVEAVTGWTENPSSSVTVVKVEVRPEELAPANKAAGRHSYGVYELVGLRHSPAIESVRWILEGGGDEEDSMDGYVGQGLGGSCCLRCPLYDNGATLKVSCRGVEYFPMVGLVEPMSVVTSNPAGQKGQYPMGVYGASMQFDMFVAPLTVSFNQIAIEEIPSEDMLYDGSTCSGYFFAEPLEKRSHSSAMGAGKWLVVRSADNFFARDTVDSGVLLAVEEDGAMSWAIPMGWHKKKVCQLAGEGRYPFFREFAQNMYWQDFFVSTNGTTSLSKHGHWVWRNLSDDIWLDGEIVQ